MFIPHILWRGFNKYMDLIKKSDDTKRNMTLGKVVKSNGNFDIPKSLDRPINKKSLQYLLYCAIHKIIKCCFSKKTYNQVVNE